MKKRVTNIFTKKNLMIAFLVILIFGVVLVVLEKKHIINFYTKTHSDSTETEAKTTSTTQTAQDDFTKGDTRDPGNTLREDGGSAEISDTNGNIDTSAQAYDPIISKTGEITVFTPQKDTFVQSGQVVSGKSSLSKVTYRIIDSVSGMIAMGELKVVEGKFSGKMNFDTDASEGRLDIFGTKDDLSEFSNIEIPMRFKQ